MLEEPLTWFHIIGMMFVLSAIYLTSIDSKTERKKNVPV
ncbi:hypothetical protein [Alteribacillus bidgolensis]